MRFAKLRDFTTGFATAEDTIARFITNISHLTIGALRALCGGEEEELKMKKSILAATTGFFFFKQKTAYEVRT